MTATVLITRPKAQSKAFAAALEDAHGGPVRHLISPLMEIVPLPVAGGFDDLRHVVFTSVHGVAQALRVGIPAGICAWCVGAKTGKAASDAGFEVHVAGGDVQNLVALIVARVPAGRMVHLRGRYVAGNVLTDVSEAGVTCESVVAYDQVAVAPTQAALDLLRGESPVIVPLFSPRTGKLFGQIADFHAPLHLIVISEAVDVAGRDVPVVSRTLARKKDMSGVIDATLASYARFSP
jgi:uroporphyrinogen-III synthase